ncbi:RsmB/NOP family class I SAM-dependent RNA methyltransferase [Parapedobacter tibetensis]|uniref:RsmB/NOP family class I SAM-dependent RNA methyltransferase n=1 Tax=Parapedobacter tibetensis TaxID=2972951 RepID=UPI00214D14E8|nr:RsmB/NOP family class I SAM-dependent RNA methyltransferase [Parapedobacter tibetensis]
MEKRIQQQIRTVERLLQEYSGDEPLARFLSGFYKRNRQMGSADRRIASRLAYNYFRIGLAAAKSPLPDRLALAEFLCSKDSAVAQLLLPELYSHISDELSQKIALLEDYTAFRLADVFPYTSHLSAGVDQLGFTYSLFTQPDLFIRLRHAHETEVLSILEKENIPYQKLSDFTIALPNGTALDRIPGLAGKYEVQDKSSQQTAAYFEASAGEHWWDACAGSGGKSLLLLDSNPSVNLLVSDTRNSILRNLDERFEAAGIKSYRRKIIDLSKDADTILGDEQFDGMILDAPCTGSGTWGRTPEQISAFDEQSIGRFATLQKQLAGNMVKHLKPGKPLIYITCSVFSAENEHVIEHLQAHHSLRLERMDMLCGYLHKADSMFVARLVK